MVTDDSGNRDESTTDNDPQSPSAPPIPIPVETKPIEPNITGREIVSDQAKQSAVTQDPTKDKPPATNKDLIERIKTSDRIMIALTVIIALSAAYSAYVFNGQLKEMQDSGRQTDKIICADQRLAAAMEKSVAQADKSFKANIEASRDDQRAWVGPYEVLPPAFTNAGKRVFMKEGEKASFGLMITNTGKTPARNVIQGTSYVSLPFKEKFVPHYPGGVENVGVIQPNAKVRALAPDTGQITKPIIGGLTSETFRFYVFGKITYDDVFGRRHHTTFCVYLLSDLSGLTACSTYNDGD